MNNVLTNATDSFGTYPKVETLYNFFNNDINNELIENNNIIALYGDWGSGKTTVLSATVEKLNNGDKYQAIIFDTWKYENTDNLSYTMLEFLVEKLNIGKTSKKVLKAGSKILSGLAKSFSLDLGAVKVDFSKLIEEAEKYDLSEDTFYKKVENYEKEFNAVIDKFAKDTKKRIIVMVDDLDRCESENVINLLSSIKHFFSINKQVIFVCAIDNKAVQLSLSHKYGNDREKAEEYLEKIFTLNFNMPKISDPIKLKNLVLSKFPDQPSADIISNLILGLEFNNPRHVKKFLDKLALIISNENFKNSDVKTIYKTELNLILLAFLTILQQHCENDFSNVLYDRKEIYHQYNINLTTESSKSISYSTARRFLDISTILHGETFKVQNKARFTKTVELLTPSYIEHTTIAVSNEYGISILEWINAIGDNINKNFLKFLFLGEGYIFIMDELQEKINEKPTAFATGGSSALDILYRDFDQELKQRIISISKIVSKYY